MDEKRKFAGVCFLSVALLICSCCKKVEKTGQLQVIRGRTMGTFFTVKYVPQSDKPGNTEETRRKIAAGIENTLLQVNRQMSIYIPDSEISRFNRYAHTDWFSVSADLAEVVHQALYISELSGGAFDITVGPLVNLWGFGPEQKPGDIPAGEKIKERMQFIGYRKLSVRLSPPALKKTIPGVYCDLGGIAKGCGVDKIAEYFDALGIGNYLIEIGGEVRAKGGKENGRCWRLGIASPDGGPGIQQAFPLKNAALATSGDYHNYFEQDGIRYSHTIDPETGKPITHKLASVTVLHDSCTAADALATAINVLGPGKGYDLAVKENLPVFLIIKGKDRFFEKKTPAFEMILSASDR